jgi:hypothetical protein
MKWGIGKTRAVGDQSDHPQRLCENDVIDGLKGQVSEKEPALCVSSAGQGMCDCEPRLSILDSLATFLIFSATLRK